MRRVRPFAPVFAIAVLPSLAAAQTILLPAGPAAPFSAPVQGLSAAPYGGYGLDPRYAAELNELPLLSREEEQALGAGALAGDVKAAQKLAAHNLRLVLSIVREYKMFGTSFADLVEEGNVGLMLATRKFDPSRGNRFSTYASWWIRATVLKHIQDNFHLGHTMTGHDEKKLFYSLRRVQEQVAKEAGPELAGDPDFIAKFMNDAEAAKPEKERSKLVIRPASVAKMIELLDHPLRSLDAPVDASGEGTATFLDMTADKGPGPEQLNSEAEASSVTNEAVSAALVEVSEIDPRYADVIRLRLYADEDDVLTLEQLGERFGLSRERVRQIEEKVKAELRVRLSDRLYGTGLVDQKAADEALAAPPLAKPRKPRRTPRPAKRAAQVKAKKAAAPAALEKPAPTLAELRAAGEAVAKRHPRFGEIILDRLAAEQPLTLAEMAKKLGCSEQRAEFLEEGAKAALQDELAARLKAAGPSGK
jgi:RNA polymerase sigma-32 factor